MIAVAQTLALMQAHGVCLGHGQALQDDIGNRLMPAILKALGEDVAAMPALDRFARLEQLGWLASAEGWNLLRQIRTQFTHDYADSPTERFERLQAATQAAHQLLDLMDQITTKLCQRFGNATDPLSNCLSRANANGGSGA